MNLISKLIEDIKSRKRDYLLNILEISISITISLVITILLMVFMRYSVETALSAYSILFSHGFTNIPYLLTRSTPLILTALAFLLPSLTGLFNIGGEGQFYLGAITSLVIAYYTGSAILAIITGGLAGGFLGLLLAILRVYKNVNEVVSAVMINRALYYILIFIISTYLADPIIPHQSISVPRSATLPIMHIHGLRVNCGFIVALLMSMCVAYIYYKTNLGFALRASGLNPKAAALAGFNIKRLMLISFIIGGGMAGMGGAVHVLSVIHNIDVMLIGLYGYGFLGIGASLLGRNNPLGVIFSSLFISGLIIGGQWIEVRLGLPHQLADLIVGIIIVSLAIPFSYHYIKLTLKRCRR
jgi:simple sugar transport system permease protein